MSKISQNQDFNVNRAYFFYFVTWISLIIWSLLVVFTNIFGNKISASRSAPASVPALGPSRPPEKFQFFFTEFQEYHLWFQIFLPKNIREYHQKGPNKQWNPGHKIKKICVVSIEIPLWWYFCQKCSCSHCILNVIYCTKILMYSYPVQCFGGMY